jgi:hypothetical protein
MGLGDIVEKIIHVVTLGQGKRIATYIAKLFGYDDCGCTRRKNTLNNLFKYVKRKSNSRRKSN